MSDNSNATWGGYNQPAHLYEIFKFFKISGFLTFPSVQRNLKKPKGCGILFFKRSKFFFFTFLPNTAYETSGTSFSLLELQLFLYKIIIHPFIADWAHWRSVQYMCVELLYYGSTYPPYSMLSQAPTAFKHFQNCDNFLNKNISLPFKIHNQTL